MENIDKIESEITELIEKKLQENTWLLGISFGTSGGTFITSKYRMKKKDLSEIELAAASSSLLFLSDNMLKHALTQEISYNLIASKNLLLISLLINDVTMTSHVDRELAELEGVDTIINDLKVFGLKIYAIVSTSDLIREEIFVMIKRAIPNALVVAIINKDGMPIKIQSNMPESAISANISAVYHLSEILTGDLEFSIIAGEMGSIILHELDENRIICVAVPVTEESKLGSYVVKIKDIVKKAT
ncbi:MAG: hypothetical protein ACFFBP_04600 [Promethearchaeota archaeon]